MGKRNVPKLVETCETYETTPEFLRDLQKAMLLVLKEGGYIHESQLRYCLERLENA